MSNLFANPERAGVEMAFRNRRGEEGPRRRLIGRRSADETRARLKIHFDLPERRQQAVARRLAHRFLAGPVPEEAAAAIVGLEAGDRGVFRRRQELPGEAVVSDHPRRELDVDADARVASLRAPQADQRHAAGVRDVEIEPGVESVEPRATPVPARNWDVGGRHRERVAEYRAQRRATGDPASAQGVSTKARGAGVLRRRQQRSNLLDLGGREIEVAPPERHAVRDARELALFR